MLFARGHDSSGAVSKVYALGGGWGTTVASEGTMKRRREPDGAAGDVLPGLPDGERSLRSHHRMSGRSPCGLAPWLGIALAVIWACVLDLQAAGSFWIDKQVVVQPIQMGSTDGSTWANLDLSIYEAESDKIWAQAGIDVKFLPVAQYQNTTYLGVSSDAFAVNSFLSLASNTGHGQNPDPTVVNLWFVNSIDSSPSVYGYSLQTRSRFGSLIEKNGVSIANSAFNYASGNGMRDIFAYEIGRNLGLDNTTLNASSDPNNLMNPSIAITSIDQIFPTGNGWGHLTPEQIVMARSTTFAVDLAPGDQYTYNDEIPEPASVGAASAGLLALWALGRRWSARKPREG